MVAKSLWTAKGPELEMLVSWCGCKQISSSFRDIKGFEGSLNLVSFFEGLKFLKTLFICFEGE